MDKSAIIIVSAAVIFLIASIINGLWKRKSRDLVSYYATPNMFSTIPLIISMLGTIIGGGIVIGMSEMGAKGGIVGIMLGFGYAIAFLILSQIVPRIRQLTNEVGVYSLIDVVENKINNPFRVFNLEIKISSLISIILFTSYFFILAAQIIAIVSFLDMMTPSSNSEKGILLVVSILCTINIIFYSAFGGLEKDIRTDLFQFALILVATFVLVSIPFQQSESPIASILTLPKHYFNGTGYGLAFIIVAIIAPLPSFIVRYDIWQRIIAANTVKAAKRTFIFLTIGVLFFFSVFSFLGMYIQSVHNLSVSEMPKALFIFMDSTQNYASAVILICLLAAVLSSADTFLNVSSISFSKLMFRSDWKRLSASNDDTVTKNHQSLLKRKTMISTVIIGLISIIVGYSFDSIVSLLIGAVSALTVLFPVIANILFKKETSSIAAFWSIILGYLSFLIFSFGLKMPEESFIPAFIVSCIIFYPINYFAIKKDQNKIK
jgi:solute:Na+ symporter, SSS family